MKAFTSRSQSQATRRAAAERDPDSSRSGIALYPPASGNAFVAQGKFEPAQMQMEEEELQGKFETAQMQMEEELQGKFEPAAQMKTDNTGMPVGVRGQMESALNSDFSDVRVHANSSRAPAVGALAYTQGSDIHFAPGQFRPDTASGQQLLGHELTHVVQQREGRVQPTTEVAGLPVNDDPGLEQEADQMGRQVAR